MILLFYDIFLSEVGHFLNLLVTDNRPEYRAAIETKYINTTSKCIALFYWIWYEEKIRTSDEINAKQVANLTVWAVDEDKKRHLVFTTMRSAEGEE